MKFLALSRSLEKELIDNPAADGAYEAVLGNFEQVCLTIGRYAAAIKEIEPLIEELLACKPEGNLRILELGGGLGGFADYFLQWAGERGLRVRVDYTFSEVSPVGLQRTRERFSSISLNGSSIKIRPIDVRHLEVFRDNEFDLVINLFTLHHIGDLKAVAHLLQEIDRISLSMFLYDGERCWYGVAGTWLALHLFPFAGPEIQHDGVLSIRRSLTQEEARGAVRESGLDYLGVYRIPPWEFCIKGVKPRLQAQKDRNEPCPFSFLGRH